MEDGMGCKGQGRPWSGFPWWVRTCLHLSKATELEPFKWVWFTAYNFYLINYIKNTYIINTLHLRLLIS